MRPFGSQVNGRTRHSRPRLAEALLILRIHLLSSCMVRLQTQRRRHANAKCGQRPQSAVQSGDATPWSRDGPSREGDVTRPSEGRRLRPPVMRPLRLNRTPHLPRLCLESQAKTTPETLRDQLLSHRINRPQHPHVKSAFKHLGAFASTRKQLPRHLSCQAWQRFSGRVVRLEFSIY